MIYDKGQRFIGTTFLFWAKQVCLQPFDNTLL